MGFEHVIPELIKKCNTNNEIIVQGDGNESRCFCYITDAINAMILCTKHVDGRNEISYKNMFR